MIVGDLPLEDQPSRLDDHGPVFILGCPRSGTTFLSRCVGAIDKADQFVGVLAGPRLMHGIAVSEGIHRELLLDLSRDVFWQTFWRTSAFRNRRVGGQQGALAMLGAALRPLPVLEGRLFVYKEPFLCFAAEAFSEYYPNSIFLHIVRDGRDNADSMLRSYPDALTDTVLTSDSLSWHKNSEIGSWRRRGEINVPWWVPEDDVSSFVDASQYGRFMFLWREMVNRSISLGRALPPKRYLQIRYEDLAAGEESAGRSVRQILGAPDTRKYQRALTEAHSRSVGIAGREQSTERLDEAQEIAGPLLRELGYL